MMRAQSTTKSAFALIELLVVIAIVGLLALRMHLDEHNRYPDTYGVGTEGFNDVYSVVVMSDWKESLVPYHGL